MKAAIFGCEGLVLTDAEAEFFRAADPWGFIVFARNIDTPDQLRALVASFRETVGRDAPVLIDQEGGRVARLRPPHWRAYPPARAYGDLYAGDHVAGLEACRLGAFLIGMELAALGIDVDCIPLADIPVPGAHDIIGDRAYGTHADEVIPLARAAAEGLMGAGGLPVLKHIPGHGRAGVDSHEALPVVETDRETLAATDFVPFKALADLPLGMTAHVVYSAIDPDRCATLSARVVNDVIRGEIGFDGLLMTDDLSMKALGGPMGARVTESLAAGCDLVLHCNGEMAEMEAIAAETPALSGKALERAKTALLRRHSAPVESVEDALHRWSQLMDASA